MADSNVSVVMTMKEANAVLGFLNVTRAAKKTADAVEQIGVQGKRGTKGLGENINAVMASTSQAVLQAGKLMVLYRGLNAAMQLLTGEWPRVVQLQEKSRQAVVFANQAAPQTTVDELMGQLIAGIRTAPGGFGQAEQFIENAIPPAVQAVQEGFTFREAMAILTGLANTSLDVTMASTRTTFNNFLTQMKAEFQKRGEFEQLGKGFETLQFIRSEDPVGKSIRMELLRGADLRLQKIAEETGADMQDLLTDAGIEKATLDPTVRARAKTERAIIQFLQPEGFAEGPGQAKTKVDEALRQILPGEASERQLAERLDEIRRCRPARPFGIETAFQAATVELENDLNRGTRGLIQKHLPTLLELSGSSRLEAIIESFLRRVKDLEGTDEEVLQSFVDDVLASKIQELRVPSEPLKRFQVPETEKEAKERLEILQILETLSKRLGNLIPPEEPKGPPQHPGELGRRNVNDPSLMTALAQEARAEFSLSGEHPRFRELAQPIDVNIVADKRARQVLPARRSEANRVATPEGDDMWGDQLYSIRVMDARWFSSTWSGHRIARIRHTALQGTGGWYVHKETVGGGHGQDPSICPYHRSVFTSGPQRAAGLHSKKTKHRQVLSFLFRTAA